MLAIDLLLLVLAVLVAVPALVFAFECAVALLPGRREDPPLVIPPPRIAVLIPAHDESAGIAATVRPLVEELGSRIVVVADNCSDDTAEAARAAGAEVIERSDPDRRGKGYALAFGTEHLAKDPPEVVIIVDADCRAAPGALPAIGKKAHARGRPVQAEYLIGAADSSPGTAVSALAFLVKNRVRPLGLFRLGLPCHLTGSGMAFPWPIWRDAPELGSNLVEDLVLGLELALAGSPPLLAPEAKVSSVLPDEATAALGQRRRWEHGHLSTLFHHGPRMILRGLGGGGLGVLALGLDLIVPPLAFLVLLLVAMTALTFVAAWFGASPIPFFISGGSFLLLSLAVLGAWAVFGRATLPARHLIAIPFYVLWKIPLYLSLLVRGRQKTWDRTARSDKLGEQLDRRG